MMSIKNVKTINGVKFGGNLGLGFFDLPESMLPAIIGSPLWKFLFLFSQSQNQWSQLLIFSVADYNRANMLLYVSIVV